MGYRLLPWRKAKNRRLIETEKFYLFDVGVSNYLAKRKPSLYTPEFGKSFEHFILGDMEIAIKVKSSKRVHTTDCKALLELAAEHPVKNLFLIAFEAEPKILCGDKIKYLPWNVFLEMLWNGDII